jgi:heme/copper-type cytochrome/quinol oxidase subunit 2
MRAVSRKLVWSAVGVTVVVTSGLIWDARRDQTLTRVDPSRIMHQIGSRARFTARVVGPGEFVLHEEAGKVFYVGQPLLTYPGPIGHDVQIEGRITNVNEDRSRKEWRISFTDMSLTDLGVHPAEPRAPEPAQPAPVVIHVTAKRYSWSFKYPNGRVSDELHLPTDRPVQLVVTSADVIHAMHLLSPRESSRPGIDAVPGIQKRGDVLERKPGRYRLICIELCGPGHHQCGADVIVEPVPEFEMWLASPTTRPANPPRL